MLSILISDDHLEIVKNLFNSISQKISDIKLIGIATTGKETIDYLKVYKPDILLLDLLMPDTNGFQVLDLMTKNELDYFSKTKVIIISSYLDKLYMKTNYSKYIYAAFSKPLNVEKIIYCINQVKEEINIKNIESYVSNELSKFNFKHSSIAYKYLKDSIIEVISDNYIDFNLENDIYRIIAMKYKKRNSKVIKWSIDKLIDRMYLNTDAKLLKYYFHVNYDKKPSAKLLIDTIKNNY